MASPTYEYFLVTSPSPFVTHVQINRPSKLNAFHEAMWLELKTIFDTLSLSPDVRAIVLSGAGDRAFTAGLDVEAASQNGVLAQTDGEGEKDVARRATWIKRHVQEFQDCISSIERCEKRKLTTSIHPPSLYLSLSLSVLSNRWWMKSGVFEPVLLISYSCHLRPPRFLLRSCSGYLYLCRH
jgi:delta(3,5)-delta(2,4)-dienoyl-CoA isomerase